MLENYGFLITLCYMVVMWINYYILLKKLKIQFQIKLNNRSLPFVYLLKFYVLCDISQQYQCTTTIRSLSWSSLVINTRDECYKLVEIDCLNKICSFLLFELGYRHEYAESSLPVRNVLHSLRNINLAEYQQFYWCNYFLQQEKLEIEYWIWAKYSESLQSGHIIRNCNGFIWNSERWTESEPPLSSLLYE